MQTSAPNTTRLFTAGMMIFVLTGIIPTGFGLAVPVFARSYGISDAAAGLLLTAHGSGAVLLVGASILGLGGLTARLSLTLFGAGLIGLWLAPIWEAKLAATFVVGMGHGLVAVVFNRRFLNEFGPKGPAMVGLINAAYAAGAILGPFVIVALGGDVPFVLGLSGVIALALVPLVQPSGQRQKALPLRGMVNRSWAILGFAAVSAMVEVGITGFGPAALIASGWTDAGAARLVSGFFLAFLMGRLSLYSLVQFVSPPVLYQCAMFGAGASLFLAAAGYPATGFVLTGGFIGVAFPSLFVWISDLLGRDGRIASAVVGASLGGVALGPLFLRPMLESFGIGSIFLVLAIAAIVAARLAAVVHVTLRRRAN